MSDYKVETLNGLLAQAQSCSDLLEAIIPLARRLLAKFSALPPRLFFLTQDGEDGLLTFEREALIASERTIWRTNFAGFAPSTASKHVRSCPPPH